MSQTGLIISEAEDAVVVDFRNAAIMDSSSLRDVEDELYALVDEHKRDRVLLDFSAVRFLASRMLGMLVALHKKAGKIGGKVIICGLPPNLYRVFEVSGLDKVLHFAGNVEEGLAALDSDGVTAAPVELVQAADPARGWSTILNRQIRILFAGALVLVPLAITVWVIWSLGAWLDDLGHRALKGLGTEIQPWPGTGALILFGLIYVIGLLTHLWVFRGFFRLVERLVTHLPGAKTIYESVRDLMKLFGGQSRRMGRVVQCSVPGTDISFLGILTNENPFGVPEGKGHHKVAVYMPYSYMLGGPTVFVSPENIVEVDMSVEQCMKLCATAQIGAEPIVAPTPAKRPARKASRKKRKPS